MLSSTAWKASLLRAVLSRSKVTIHKIADQVPGKQMSLLDPWSAAGWCHEALIASQREFVAMGSGESNRERAGLSCRRQCLENVGRSSAGTDADHAVSWTCMGLHLSLIHI